MLKRKITARLEDWANSEYKKCLMLRGPRQVGKTFSVREFGKHFFSSCIYINFQETPSMNVIFSGDLDVNTLLINFSLYLPGADFIPGETLLILDEIQECPEAITSLKFWAQDGRYRVIATGSMLGIDYKRPSSYPVGSVEYLDMFALDFEEFLWACEVNQSVIDILRESFLTLKAVPEAIHGRMIQLFKTYLILGGMPDIVNTYLETHSLVRADEKQRAILEDYRYDIAHYARPEIKLKAEKCYFSLPKQLSKENHKFQYSVVEKGGTARKYDSSLDWLENARLTVPVRNVSTIHFPLSAYMQENQFRLYPADIGLLIGMFPYPMKASLMNEDDLYYRMPAKGGIYEAVIADMLIKNGFTELYYRKTENGTFEIEFLLPHPDGIIPLEVKAANSRSRSLDHLLEREDIPYGCKLISGNVGRDGKKLSIPHYLAMFLQPGISRLQ